MLALTTTGRRSGVPRSTVIAYLRHGKGYAVGALNLGSDDDPAWYLNLRSQPQAVIEVDGERKKVTAREAAGSEAETLWRALIARNPPTANARALAQRHVPILVLDPVS